MSKKIINILLICYGNTARSPAAEYLAKYYASKYEVDLIFDSAGFINAFSYMQPESQDYLNLKGIDHSNFRPKIIDKALLEKNDLIITMETKHIKLIKKNYPNNEDLYKKIFTLKVFNGGKGDIIDPYYTNKTTYRNVLMEIDDNIEKMIKKIIDLNK